MSIIPFVIAKNNKKLELENNSRAEIHKYYNLLSALQKHATSKTIVTQKWIDTFIKCRNAIYATTKDTSITSYDISPSPISRYANDRRVVHKMYSATSAVRTIDSLMHYIKINYIDIYIFNTETLRFLIRDDLLRERCLDILIGKSAFDRVINQATQVLEDKIKKKARLQNTKLIGQKLIAKAITSDKDTSILLFSTEPDIQESYSFLFKGVAGVYRNPTHHSTDYSCTKEDALKCCIFIDYLLEKLSHCKVQKVKT